MVCVDLLKAKCWLLCLIVSLVLAIPGETAANRQKGGTLRGRAGRLNPGRDSWRESEFKAPMIDDRDQREDNNRFDDDRFASRAGQFQT